MFLTIMCVCRYFLQINRLTGNRLTINIHHLYFISFFSDCSTSGLLNLFAVESPSGKVTLQKSGLDYEQYAKYTVTLNSTDSGFPPYSVTGSFVVSVHNINENPQNISLSNNQVQ